MELLLWEVTYDVVSESTNSVGKYSSTNCPKVSDMKTVNLYSYIRSDDKDKDKWPKLKLIKNRTKV